MPRFNQTISLIGVCSGLGQSKPGLELAPDVLRKSGLLTELQTSDLMILDHGDIHPSGTSEDHAWDLIARLHEKSLAVLKRGDRLFTFGGDHSVAIATVGASLEAYPDLRVVWVDAHGDMNTPFASPSGNLHGMPLAALLGLFKADLPTARLKPENLLMIGVRDLDPFEKEIIVDLKIEIISTEEMNSNDGRGLRRLTDWLSLHPADPVHLSFDIDSMDPSVAPATGLHVNDGLSFTAVDKLVSTLARTVRLIAVDVVEFNPLSAMSDLEIETTTACVKMIFKNSLNSPQTEGQIHEKVVVA